MTKFTNVFAKVFANSSLLTTVELWMWRALTGYAVYTLLVLKKKWKKLLIFVNLQSEYYEHLTLNGKKTYRITN